jgi:GxxExxY protein
MGDLLYKELTYQIRSGLFEVYNTLGPGFREETYKIAVLAEMRRRGVRTAREVGIEVHYKGELIDIYRADIVVDDKVILELKAVDQLHPRFKAQLLSYLTASNLRLGLLVNFGSDKLEIIRVINWRLEESVESVSSVYAFACC